jgi:hypothetical protein
VISKPGGWNSCSVLRPRNEAVLEGHLTRPSVQIIAFDTGILHGLASAILAPEGAVEAGAGALNLDAMLSGRLAPKSQNRHRIAMRGVATGADPPSDVPFPIIRRAI